LVLKEWHEIDGSLVREFTFPDFQAAFNFLTGVAKLAEEHEHHPDIELRYNRLKLSLRTHDEQRVGPKDYDLAQKINALL